MPQQTNTQRFTPSYWLSKLTGKRRRALKVLLVTALAFVLSLVLLQPFSFSAGSMLNSADKSDFNMTDFYNVVANSRPESELDTNVVVVDIAFTDRDDVINVIDLLGDLEPRAVGLDVTFNEPRPGDERLFEAIDRCPNLVMAVGVDVSEKGDDGTFHPEDYSYFYGRQCAGHLHGVINLPSKAEGSTIRNYRKYFPIETGDTLESLALALTRIVSPEAANRAMARRKALEIIDYPSRQFDILPWFELPDNPDFVKDKIVLVGSIGETGDTHATPVDPQMAGVLIHAHALQTLLASKFYYETPRWLNMLFSFLVCFLITFCYIGYTSPAKGMWMRLIQLSFVIGIVFVGYYLFLDRKVIIDFSYTLLMVTFCFFALDLWTGLEHYFKKGYTAIRNLKTKK